MEHIVKILDIKEAANQVKSFRLEKPTGYTFNPGQATDVSVNTEALKSELRPFTFTCLTGDPFLEFTIKRYPDHHGITDAIHRLKIGDELIIRDVWGAIEYKGPGYFIAGGAGITPFLAILRWLHKENKLVGNKLLFSNKTVADIIYEKELQAMLGKEVLFILTREEKQGYLKGPINKAFLQEYANDSSRHYYICGPDAMVADLNETVTQLGAAPDAVVFEK
ncbi:MAG: flavodoxin reductase [Bacteroidota bacterium]